MSASRAARERPSGPTDGQGRHARLWLAVLMGTHARRPYACRRFRLRAPRSGHQPALCTTPSRHRVWSHRKKCVIATVGL